MNRIWLLLVLWAIPVAAQSPVAAVVDQLAATRRFSEVAISPDGRRVAWVEDVHGSDGEPTAHTAIFVLDLTTPGARPHPLTPHSGAAAREQSPAWSPDGSHLLFLSDAQKAGQPQLYSAPAAGGAARKLTSLDGVLSAPGWSPDGKSASFLFVEGASGLLGPVEAVPPRTGLIDEGFTNQRLMLMDAASGHPRAVSPADLNVYEYAWSPDGRRFAVTAAPGPGDNNWWTAQLYSLEAAGGRMTPLYRPPADLQIAGPHWSPDGRTIAFVAGLMSDQAVTGGDVFLIGAEGGAPRNLTAGRRASASSVAWTGAGNLLVTEWSGGGSRIVSFSAAGGAGEVLWSGEEDCHSDGYGPTFSVAGDGRTSAFTRSSFTRPPEVWAGPIGGWKQVTHYNDGRSPAWGEARSLEWTSDGFSVQGWLLFPRDYSPARRYPMVVDVHGGPASSMRSSWPREFYSGAPLAAAGYFVFFPNPRGSYGQGEAFTRANVKDLGGGDLRDILAGIDRVLATVSVDPNRIGLTGWSYGGFMTMFAVTQTHRFRAAVAGAGIANWQSYYGQNSIDQWMIPYFGASVYDDPAVYARASAINFIRQVKTPTLVVVGERDGECPAPQSFEFWHALKTLGVKTNLVVYAGEGHAFRKPENRRDVMRRAIGWFEEYLNEPADSNAGRK